jgi:glycosyltransferase involved in cell wall biosynthesis
MNEIDNAFLCVLPSYFETFAMAAMEVAARGRALLFSEINTGKELIDDGKTGWLIHPDNTEHIADTIIYAFEHPEETSQIARAGYEKCKSEFSTEVIIPQLERYYQNIIDKQPK